MRRRSRFGLWWDRQRTTPINYRVASGIVAVVCAYGRRFGDIPQSLYPLGWRLLSWCERTMRRTWNIHPHRRGLWA